MIHNWNTITLCHLAKMERKCYYNWTIRVIPVYKNCIFNTSLSPWVEIVRGATKKITTKTSQSEIPSSPSLTSDEFQVVLAKKIRLTKKTSIFSHYYSLKKTFFEVQTPNFSDPPLTSYKVFSFCGCVFWWLPLLFSCHNFCKVLY